MRSFVLHQPPSGGVTHHHLADAYGSTHNQSPVYPAVPRKVGQRHQQGVKFGKCLR